MKETSDPIVQFIHLESCSDDLNDAWNVLQLIKKNPDSLLRFSSFKYALVAYCRAYLAWEYVDGSKFLGLNSSFVPTSHRAVHDRVLNARHKRLAHSDLGMRDPRLDVLNIDGYISAQIAQNVAADLPSIDEAIGLVEKTLDALYAHSDAQRRDLQPTN